MKTERLIRQMELRALEGSEGPTYKIKGYASTFEPYVLWTDGEIDYSEVIDARAFGDTDMSDVVLRIDHCGAVYARTKAENLVVGTDDHGLWFEADLSRTENQRRLFEDVEAGLYPQASFAFTVSSDDYDSKTHTRTITGIDKLYDVSPVSFPANPGTEVDVATRAFLDGAIEKDRAERLAIEQRELEQKRREELKKKILMERIKK